LINVSIAKRFCTIPFAPKPERSLTHLCAFVCGQHDHFCDLRQLRDLIRRGSLHLQIQQQNIACRRGQDAAKARDRLNLANDFDVIMQLKKRS
jgi:hypothetical protein